MMPGSKPINPHQTSGPSRVIQGFFPGGLLRILRPASAGVNRPPALVPAPLQPKLADHQPPTVPGRPNPIQPASRPGFPSNKPQPILPNTPRLGTVQPFIHTRPSAPQPILPNAPRSGAVQPFDRSKLTPPQPILPQAQPPTALQAEADRMGRLAASHLVPVPMKATSSPVLKNAVVKAQPLSQTLQRRISIGPGPKNVLAKKRAIIAKLRELHMEIRQKAAARFVAQGAGPLADVLWALNDVTPFVEKLAEILAHRDVDLQFTDWNEALDYLIPIVVPYDPVPEVVALKEQTTQKQLSEMILLPEYAKKGRLLFRAGGVQVPGTHVLRPGNRIVYCRYEDEFNRMGTVHEFTLNIKPTIKEVMTEMGFTEKGWRWDLPYGTHGALNLELHLSVPTADQALPENYVPNTVDGLKTIFEGLFPKGSEFEGTHMTLECRRDYTKTNASVFLNGSEKQTNEVYTSGEKDAFIKACRSKLNAWNKDSLTKLLNALKNLAGV